MSTYMKALYQPFDAQIQMEETNKHSKTYGS